MKVLQRIKYFGIKFNVPNSLVIKYGLFLMLFLLLGCESLKPSNEGPSYAISDKLIIPKSIKKIEYNDQSYLAEFNPNVLNEKLTIVSYIDGDCSECVKNLDKWEEFSKHHQKFGYMILIYSSNIRLFYFQLFKKRDYEIPIYYDPDRQFQQINHLPDDKSFNTFLIDKENRIVQIGNPIDDEQHLKLYLDNLTSSEL
jgi:hypothetical protein